MNDQQREEQQQQVLPDVTSEEFLRSAKIVAQKQQQHLASLLLSSSTELITLPPGTLKRRALDIHIVNTKKASAVSIVMCLLIIWLTTSVIFKISDIIELKEQIMVAITLVALLIVFLLVLMIFFANNELDKALNVTETIADQARAEMTTKKKIQ